MMKKNYFFILMFVIVMLVAIFFVWRIREGRNSPTSSQIPQTFGNSDKNTNLNLQNQNSQENNTQQASLILPNGLSQPLADVSSRVTKKPFGIYITPKNSPVQPEKFQGFHTGTDFETFANEADVDVGVHAVCQGKLLEKMYASGYGGVAIESCTLEGKPITVIYGHLNLASITSNKGEILNVGQQFAVLGKGYSTQTDGERKHLHLGFHHGTSINILGYVETEAALPDWLDPCLYVCGK